MHFKCVAPSYQKEGQEVRKVTEEMIPYLRYHKHWYLLDLAEAHPMGSTAAFTYPQYEYYLEQSGLSPVDIAVSEEAFEFLPDAEEKPDMLKNCSIKELRAFAEENGISIPSNLRKKEDIYNFVSTEAYKEPTTQEVEAPAPTEEEEK